MEEHLQSENELSVNDELPSQPSVTQTGKNSKFSRYYSFIKDNKEIIVLVPSILGASWQILELANIQFSYIRFFSASQAIIDGILILTFIGIPFIYFYISRFLLQFTMNSKFKFAYEDLREFRGNRKLYIVKQIIIIFFIIVIAISTIWYSIHNLFSNSPIFTFFLLWIIGFSSTSEIIKRLVRINVLYNFKENLIVWIKNKDRETLENTISLVILSTIILLIFIIKTTYPNLRDIFSSTSSLKNLNNLNQLILKDYKSNNHILRYMNDKYIFIQLCQTPKCQNDKDEQIVIYKTEDALFKTDKP